MLLVALPDKVDELEPVVPDMMEATMMLGVSATPAMPRVVKNSRPRTSNRKKNMNCGERIRDQFTARAEVGQFAPVSSTADRLETG